MPSLLENDKIKLRPLEPEDLGILYAWENDTNLWHVGDTLCPYSIYLLKQYLENSHKDIFELKQLRLVIEEKQTNSAIGLIDLFEFDPLHLRAGLGILIYNPEKQRQGFASAALQIMIQYCFERLLLNQIYCNVGKNNTKSLALMKKVGFKVVGTKKEWRKTATGWEDEILLQIINNNKI